MVRRGPMRRLDRRWRCCHCCCCDRYRCLVGRLFGCLLVAVLVSPSILLIAWAVTFGTTDLVVALLAATVNCCRVVEAVGVVATATADAVTAAVANFLLLLLAFVLPVVQILDQLVYVDCLLDRFGWPFTNGGCCAN